MIYFKEMDGKVYPAINIQRENITLLIVRDNRHCQIKTALRNAEKENNEKNVLIFSYQTSRNWDKDHYVWAQRCGVYESKRNSI